MKWLLLNMPQFMMNFMIWFLVHLPEGIRLRMFLLLAPSMFSMTDEELDRAIHKMTKAVFKLPSETANYRFAQTRLQSLMHMPEKEAVRLVGFMSKACQEGTLSEYTRDQGMMQRAISRAPREMQLKAIKILSLAGATGALPVSHEETCVNCTKPVKNGRFLCEDCERPIAPEKQTESRRITYEDLKEWMNSKKEFTVVEVLVRENYDSGHIPGAINIPADQFERVAPKVLKKSDTIVVYCRDLTCMLSPRSAAFLVEQGYKNVYHFPGGKVEWIRRGDALETARGKHCTLAGCES